MLKRDGQAPKHMNEKMQRLVDRGRWESPQAEISMNVQEPMCDERTRVTVSQQRLNVREVLKGGTMT